MIIKNGNIICENQIKYGEDLHISGSLIVEDKSDGEIIDATGLYVCPGFVDIHTHGGFGGDFMDATDEAFEKALRFHGENGTTSILATSVTAPVDQIIRMLEMVRKYKAVSDLPCRVLGAHIEGPYLSYKNKGAQHEKYLRNPEKDSYDFIIENQDVVKTVTIAPELDGAAKMTADLKRAGIKVHGGHDDGEKDTILPAIENGLSHCTHLWCAMSTVAIRDGVRNVGLVELGLIDDRLTVEVIADNHHITPEMIKLIYKCKGADKMCIVSDSLRAGGMPENDTLYTLGRLEDENAQKFIVYDGVARLPDKSRMAGSIQPLSKMVKNLVFDAGIPLADAIKMASFTPAKIIGVHNTIGSLDIGKRADVVLLDDQLNVKMTIKEGKVIYDAENRK